MRLYGCLFLLLCSFYSAASDLNAAYKEGAQLGAQHAKQSLDALKGLNLKEFPGYQESHPEEQYYSGVTQEGTGLEEASQRAASQAESSKSINESFNQRPLYHVNPASESMQKLNQIADNADEIMHGANTSTTTCSLKPKECQYSWQEKKCLLSKESNTVHCARHLRIKTSLYKTENYTLYLNQGTKRTPYKIMVNLATPDTCKNGKTPCYILYKDSKVAPAIQLPKQCAMLKTSIHDEQGLVTIQKTASCSDLSLSLSIGICQNGRCTAPYTHSAIATVELYEAKEFWDNQCQHVEQKERDGLCHQTLPFTCTEPNQTHVIGDVAFTRACWKEKATFVCGTPEQNTCQSMIQDGCEQTNSICIKEESGRCLSYQQTYQCPLNQCTDNQMLCGEETFCLDGDCASHEYSPSSDEDLKKSISNLSAVSEASKNFNGAANVLFQGQLLECSNLMKGFANCCRDSGWGIDLNLAHCSDLEKKLGSARQNKLVVPTGKYCFKRKKFPGGSICKEEHETFCVFQSKLARMIQEQGRRNQLGISFGQAQFSNCAGITPQQLQLIRFESIDFTEFYSELNNKMKSPDYQQTAQGMSQRLKDFYSQGDING